MVVKLLDADGVKVYNVTAGKKLPSWVTDKRRKQSLNKDETFSKHLELIQDFGFPSACHKVKNTQDQQYIFACGVHAPRLRVYDLHNLALKFERHFDAEVVDFQILTEDYSKCVLLCNDRTVNFQTRMGKHFVTRVPKAGRDLAYLDRQAEVVIAGSAPELWRIDLSEGRFQSPIPTSTPAVNACGVSPVHGMVAVAGEDGVLECFDFRAGKAIGRLDVASTLDSPGESLTALRFDDTGLNIATGSAGGKVAIFDLRRSTPMTVKDHMYDSAIKDIKFHKAVGDHTSQQRVISTDSHIVKVWDMGSGKPFTNIETDHGDINDVCVWPGSGLIFVAGDFTQIGAYFAPALGPAPRWCSFLEGIVEDLEQSNTTTVYDDYRFVTKGELERLELDHLLGTPMVRAYMHGFFIDNRLYHKAKNRKEPFAYETYRQKRIAEKMEEERKSRISTVRCYAIAGLHPADLNVCQDGGDKVKKLPKVNAQAHVRLQAAELAAADSERKGVKQDGEVASALLQDDRFKALFEDQDFEIDERSHVYRELHPNASTRKKSTEEALIEEHFQEVGSDNDENNSDVDEAERYSASASEGTDDEDRFGSLRKRARLYAAREERSADLFSARESTVALRNKPLAERLADPDASTSSQARIGGNREASFTPRRSEGALPKGGRSVGHVQLGSLRGRGRSRSGQHGRHAHSIDKRQGRGGMPHRRGGRGPRGSRSRGKR